MSGESLNMQKWDALLERLRTLEAEYGLVAVALSGGLDSRFLVHAAQKAGVEVALLHAVGPHMPARESAQCREWVKARGLTLHEVTVDTLELDGVRDNSRERCYHCKRRLLELLWAETRHLAGEKRGAGGLALGGEVQHGVLCDGTNADDLGVYRPGLRALREAGVRSPLAEATLSKAQLRKLGAVTGLEDPGQVARPCLLTRLAYGLTPERTLLRRVEAAEQALENLGLTDFRLRICPQPVLQTRPLTQEQRKAVVELLQTHGFGGVEILEEAQIGGFFDRDRVNLPGAE